MTQDPLYGRRLERFLLGMAMSVVLLFLERRVLRLQRASSPPAR